MATSSNTTAASTGSWFENVVTPGWMRVGMPLVTWRKRASSAKKIYLTFDDGPTAQITAQLLATLKQFNAKATFFCLGENVERNPRSFAELVAGGHLIGNHSYHHLNGWTTGTKRYVDDVLQCQHVLSQELNHSPRHFRPPYGRISFRQLIQVRRRFEIVMWDILSMDYRSELTGTQVANNVIQNARAGSIVVLHDSNLAADRVTVALPLILQQLTNSGFQFCTLNE